MQIFSAGIYLQERESLLMSKTSIFCRLTYSTVCLCHLDCLRFTILYS